MESSLMTCCAEYWQRMWLEGIPLYSFGESELWTANGKMQCLRFLPFSSGVGLVVAALWSWPMYSTLVLINVVILHGVWLVVGWVTVCRGGVKMQNVKMMDHQNYAAWKCKTWKWWTIEIIRDENAGRENDVPSKSQGARMQDMKMQDLKMLDTKIEWMNEWIDGMKQLQLALKLPGDIFCLVFTTLKTNTKKACQRVRTKQRV